MTNRPRCTTRGCPTRYRGGPDRPCPIHADDDHGSLSARMTAYTEAMAASGTPIAADTDGHQDGGDPPDDQPTTLAAYLAQRPPTSL